MSKKYKSWYIHFKDKSEGNTADTNDQGKCIVEQ